MCLCLFACNVLTYTFLHVLVHVIVHLIVHMSVCSSVVPFKYNIYNRMCGFEHFHVYVS